VTNALRSPTPVWCLLAAAIIGVGAYCATPTCLWSGRVTLHDRERALQDNLSIIRDRILQFRKDRGRYPESLDQLVKGGYLRKVPQDPFAHFPNAWRLDRNDVGGIIAVRSRSDALSRLMSRYSEW
jgi:general secretion pathway protein G